MRITPSRILLAGWLLFLVYAYPGYLSPDPVLQLMEARRGDWGDWHPPVMGFLWVHLEWIVTGTLPMLILQSGALLLGLYAILRRLLSDRRAAYTAAGLLLFPPVMTTMAVIWKDSQMAGYLLAGTACLLSPRLRWRLAGCALLSLATMMRYNALAATLPLVVLLFEWRPGMRRLKRYGIAALVWIAITVFASQVNSTLAKRKTFPWALGAYHDIAGILYHHPLYDSTFERLLPGRLRIHENIAAELDARYAPWNAYYLAFESHRVFLYPQNETEAAVVRHAWLELIRRYPGAYLHHRLRVTREILGLSKNALVGPVWNGFDEHKDTLQIDDIGVSMRLSKWQALWWHAVAYGLGQTLLFRPYLYFFVSLLLLWLVRRSPLDLALVLSGLCYEGTIFVAAVPDTRYSHWMFVCTIVAYVRTVILRMRAAPVSAG